MSLHLRCPIRMNASVPTVELVSPTMIVLVQVATAENFVNMRLNVRMEIVLVLRHLVRSMQRVCLSQEQQMTTIVFASRVSKNQIATTLTNAPERRTFAAMEFVKILMEATSATVFLASPERTATLM